jgi:hypothetical protein
MKRQHTGASALVSADQVATTTVCAPTATEDSGAISAALAKQTTSVIVFGALRHEGVKVWPLRRQISEEEARQYQRRVL